MPAFIIIGTSHALDSQSFSTEEISQMRDKHVLNICQQKPKNEHCQQINFILSHFQNSPQSKLGRLKGPFLPKDHARAMLHFQTTDLGKIMGWDEDRIEAETDLLFAAIDKAISETPQIKKF